MDRAALLAVTLLGITLGFSGSHVAGGFAESSPRLEVTPDSAVMAVGDSRVFAAQAYDMNGTPIPGLLYNWSVVGGIGGVGTGSGDQTTFTASATGSGRVVAKAKYMMMELEGDATVTVGSGGGGGSVRVVVNPASASLAVSDRKNFTAQAYDGNGSPVHASYVWRVVGGVGTVSPSTGPTVEFTATTMGMGKLEVNATAQGAWAVGYADLMVMQSGGGGGGGGNMSMVRVVVTPPAASVVVGAQQGFAVQAYDHQGKPIGNASYRWILPAARIGSIAPNTGQSTVFTAASPGSGRLFAIADVGHWVMPMHMSGMMGGMMMNMTGSCKMSGSMGNMTGTCTMSGMMGSMMQNMTGTSSMSISIDAQGLVTISGSCKMSGGMIQMSGTCAGGGQLGGTISVTCSMSGGMGGGQGNMTMNATHMVPYGWADIRVTTLRPLLDAKVSSSRIGDEVQVSFAFTVTAPSGGARGASVNVVDAAGLDVEVSGSSRDLMPDETWEVQGSARMTVEQAKAANGRVLLFKVFSADGESDPAQVALSFEEAILQPGPSAGQGGQGWGLWALLAAIGLAGGVGAAAFFRRWHRGRAL